ncbi:MAG: hypothetical protein J6X16_06690 [Bacteroidales bacterium]|nr:hypothetical protein [Bacteroidales bacterium]
MNKQQLASYKQTRWKRFSQTIIDENNYCCSRCGRKETEGATLQVHHKYYEQNKSPWEYPPKAFEVLCKACHAKEHGHIMPTDGWEYIECEDMGEPCVDCEYPNCTYEGQLRYVHTVYHPKWGYLNVGCGHANKLTATCQASEKEKDFKNFLKENKWIHSDNRYIREYSEYLIIIKHVADYYALTIYNIQVGNTYASLFEAQSAAFGICNNHSSKTFCEQYGLLYPDSEHKKPRSKSNPTVYKNKLTFAYNYRKGKLLHVDSVEPYVLCHCTCPACGESLYADNTSENIQQHQFRHYNDQQCISVFEEMYRQLALQLIEENKQITLPSYNNPEVELSIPSQVIQDISIKKSEIYDAIIEYRINDTAKQIGVVINLTNSISEERLLKIKQENLSTIEIKLSEFKERSIKLKELRDQLLNIQDFASWLMHPQYEQQEKLLFEAKNVYVNKLNNLIPLTINSCIKGDDQIDQIAERYLSCEEFPVNTKSLFNQHLKKTIQRIIQKPTNEDCIHTDNCLQILKWYYHYDNDTLYDILHRCDFVELAKQMYNHTERRLGFMHEVFNCYFSEDYSLDRDYAIYQHNSIRDNIQISFFKCSPFFDKPKLLTSQRKYGMELCFLLFLYYRVTSFSWKGYKKKKMYEQLYKADNLPIFAAVGSLWFGHVFNIFQTNDFQAFIETIVSQYPKASPWVLTYIENTKIYKEKYSDSDCILKLKTLQKNSENCWLAAVLYSAFNYTFEKPLLP